MSPIITNCDDVNDIKTNVCKQTNDIHEFLTNDTAPTTNYGLTPLKKIVNDSFQDYVIPTETTYNLQEIDNRVDSILPNNGYTSKEASKFITEVSASNILKFADATEYFKVDGKIVSYNDTDKFTFDLSQGNNRTGYAGAGDNSFVPHVEPRTSGATNDIAIKKGDYYVVNNNIYKAINNAPQGTTLTDTNYFKTRDFIDSQVLVAMDANGTPYIEPMIVNAYQKDSVDTVMVNNGFSRVENGLYSKGLGKYTPIAYVNMLNKGAYHPTYNITGVSRAQNSANNWRDWFATDQDADYSVAFCFGTKGIISGTLDSPLPQLEYIARPDDKYADIIYSDQIECLRTSAINGLPNHSREISKDIAGEIRGYEDYSPTNPYQTSLKVEDLTGTAQTVFNLTKKATVVHEVLKSTDGGTTWTSISFTHQSVANTVTVVASDLIKVSYTYSPTLEEIDISLMEKINQDDYVYAINTNDITDGANIANSRGAISVGTDPTEKLAIAKIVADIVSHTAETQIEDVLVTSSLYRNIDDEILVIYQLDTGGVLDLTSTVNVGYYTGKYYKG